jgi:hypothetical protein
MTSPFYFFTESDGKSREAKPLSVPGEVKVPSIVNHVQPQATPVKEEIVTNTKQGNELPPVAYNTAIAAPAYTYVNLIETIAPQIKQLKGYQEEQVKEALEASKKVLEEKQWKDVEKSIADAMTSSEKDVLKGQYEKALSKVNWNKMEDKLRIAYDKIDWNSVNDNLNKAIVEIKMDSLQHVYSTAMTELSSLQKELCENDLKGIPDTDISLKSVEQTKKNVQNAINTLNKVRTRKIVHL